MNRLDMMRGSQPGPTPSSSPGDEGGLVRGVGPSLRRMLTGGGPQFAGPRQVRCYLCRHQFTVGCHAKSTSCPGCHKPIFVEDFVLRKNKPKFLMITKIQTCGKIVVPKRTRLVANLIEAMEGVQVLGHLEAKQVHSGHCVTIGRTAYWRGGLTAPAVIIVSGAVIAGGYFDIGEHATDFAKARHTAKADALRSVPPVMAVKATARARS